MILPWPCMKTGPLVQFGVAETPITPGSPVVTVVRGRGCPVQLVRRGVRLSRSQVRERCRPARPGPGLWHGPDGRRVAGDPAVAAGAGLDRGPWWQAGELLPSRDVGRGLLRCRQRHQVAQPAGRLPRLGPGLRVLAALAPMRADRRVARPAAGESARGGRARSGADSRGDRLSR